MGRLLILRELLGVLGVDTAEAAEAEVATEMQAHGPAAGLVAVMTALGDHERCRNQARSLALEGVVCPAAGQQQFLRMVIRAGPGRVACPALAHQPRLSGSPSLQHGRHLSVCNPFQLSRLLTSGSG